MITPNEFIAASNARLSSNVAAHLPKIRAHFDIAIKQAQDSATSYTVKVPVTRKDWPMAAIQAVIEEYAAAGWAIDTSDGNYLVQLTARSLP